MKEFTISLFKEIVKLLEEDPLKTSKVLKTTTSFVAKQHLRQILCKNSDTMIFQSLFVKITSFRNFYSKHFRLDTSTNQAQTKHKPSTNQAQLSKIDIKNKSVAHLYYYMSNYLV